MYINLTLYNMTKYKKILLTVVFAFLLTFHGVVTVSAHNVNVMESDSGNAGFRAKTIDTEGGWDNERIYRKYG